jgi:membrane protein involved in colicin uptake
MAARTSDALKERIGTLSLDKQEKIEADAAKAERKAEKKAETEAKKKAVSRRHNERCSLSIRYS